MSTRVATFASYSVSYLAIKDNHDNVRISLQAYPVNPLRKNRKSNLACLCIVLQFLLLAVSCLLKALQHSRNSCSSSIERPSKLKSYFRT